MSISVFVMFVPILLDVTSTMGDSPVTVISSVTPPIWSVSCTVNSCPTKSTRPVCVAVWKPWSSALIVYLPGSRVGTRTPVRARDRGPLESGVLFGDRNGHAGHDSVPRIDDRPVDLGSAALRDCGDGEGKTMSDPVSSSETRLTMESSNPFDYFW